MSILLRRFAAALGLLAVLLSVPQGVLVLCAGAGGHLALEALCAEGPAGAHDHADASRPADAGHCECGEGCGPCRDSQVGIALASTRARDHEVVTVLLDAPAPAASPVAAFVSAPPRLALTPAAPARTPSAAASRVRAGLQLRI